MTQRARPRISSAGPRRKFLRLHHWRESERGQALVETAMILPVLLVLLFGLVDFGRAFYTWLVVTNAAREGARVGAVQGDSGQITTQINDTLGSLNPASLTISLTNVQGPRGETVDVDLVYDFDYATPIGSLITLIGGAALAEPTISASASMRLE